MECTAIAKYILHNNGVVFGVELGTDLMAHHVAVEKPIVKEALKTKNTVGIGKQREVVLFFIKHRMYLMLDMMGKIRKWQKEHR